MFDGGSSTACQIDPGYDVDLLVEAQNRELHRWLSGRITWREATEAGSIVTKGPQRLASAFPRWFVSPFAEDVQWAVKQQQRRAS